MAQTGSVILDGVGKDYEVGEGLLQVLNGVDLEIAAGSDVVITGPSGTGKSTLLHLLGALERPSRGTIRVNGRDLAPLSDDEVASFRNREVGFVFQDHHLLPQFSVLQNVVLPSVAASSRGMSSADGESAEARARRLLEAVGLSDRLEHRPAQLSGGERQRAAIARSLINQPSLLLCDEPTGNLDAATADRVSDLLFEMHRLASEASGASLVTVTHSTELAARFSRRLVVTAAGQLDDVTGRAGE